MVCESFHRACRVVPVEQTQIGYRLLTFFAVEDIRSDLVADTGDVPPFSVAPSISFSVKEL